MVPARGVEPPTYRLRIEFNPLLHQQDTRQNIIKTSGCMYRHSLIFPQIPVLSVVQLRCKRPADYRPSDSTSVGPAATSEVRRNGLPPQLVLVNGSIYAVIHGSTRH